MLPSIDFLDWREGCYGAADLHSASSYDNDDNNSIGPSYGSHDDLTRSEKSFIASSCHRSDGGSSLQSLSSVRNLAETIGFSRSLLIRPSRFIVAFRAPPGGGGFLLCQLSYPFNGVNPAECD